jgi:hypothetical protein
MSLYKVSMNYGKTGSVHYLLRVARERLKEKGNGYHIYKLVASEYSKHLPASQRSYTYKEVK